MGSTLYLECTSGISGDMLVAALLDAGASEERLLEALGSLGVDGFEARVSRVSARGVDACDFDVVLDDEHENHDHDMAWLFGEEEHGHHHHHHGHDHDHEHHHHHEHRGLADVLAIVDSAGLSPRARDIATHAFTILADAEAKAHGTTRDEVHFHEVGAIDSIVDVIAAAVCLDDLDVTDVILSPLAEGEGTVRCAHGVLPIPVPAVANIVAAQGLVLAPAGRKGELVTPTGAALAAAIKTLDALPSAHRVLAVGTGAGKRAYEPRSILRAFIIEPAETAPKRPLIKLETEVDDCTGEALGYTMARLYDAGALEVHFIPCVMKKNRPGYQLEVLCTEATREALELIIFEDTTTIGIRRSELDRTALPREKVTLTCEYGTFEAKRVTLPNGVVRNYPEYDSVAALAGEAGIGFQDAFRVVSAACQRYAEHVRVAPLVFPHCM